MADVSLASIAHVSEDVIVRELEGEAVLLNLESGIYFGLDAVGARIWHLIEQYGALSAVLDQIVSEFDVDTSQAERDLIDLVRQLSSRGLVDMET